MDIKTTQPGALVVSYDATSAIYRSATVVNVHEDNATVTLSFTETENVSVSIDNTTKTVNQPLKGGWKIWFGFLLG